LLMLKTIQRKYPFAVLFLIVIQALLSAQEIVPAGQAFSQISQRYGQIEDYQADMQITMGNIKMSGVVFYKSPNLLRINFSEPKEQVMVSDGEQFMLYLPEQSVTMSQTLKRHNESTLTTMAAGQGLNLLSRNYAISYLDSPNLVPLAEGSRERVRKFRLEWRSTEEGFRQIIVSVGENGFIRRMEAITKEYQEVRYDLTNIVVNQNIPDARFQFDSPPSSYTINNFLFEPEE